MAVVTRTLRRWFLFLLPAVLAAAIEDHQVPVAPEVVNNFSRAWQGYIEKLRDGQIDLIAWARVLTAWNRMTKG